MTKFSDRVAGEQLRSREIGISDCSVRFVFSALVQRGFGSSHGIPDLDEHEVLAAGSSVGRGRRRLERSELSYPHRGKQDICVPKVSVTFVLYELEWEPPHAGETSSTAAAKPTVGHGGSMSRLQPLLNSRWIITPAELLQYISDFLDLNQTFGSDALRNLLIATQFRGDYTKYIGESVRRRWCTRPVVLRFHKEFNLPLARIEEIWLERPLRSTRVRLTVCFDVPSSLLKLIADLEKDSAESFQRQYPTQAVLRARDSTELNLQLPRFGAGDSIYGENGENGSVASFQGRRNGSRVDRTLSIGDLVQLKCVLSGRCHNKHQRHALCLRAQDWIKFD